MVQIYAPDGPLGPPPMKLAPSPRVLAGLRIGVLDNAKPNARLLMERAARQIAAVRIVAPVRYRRQERVRKVAVRGVDLDAIGVRNTRRYALTAETFDVHVAQRIGLVQTICPVGGLDAAAAPVAELPLNPS